MWRILPLLSLMTQPQPLNWTPSTNGAGFATGQGQVLDPQAGQVCRSLDLSYRWQQVSEPGQYAEWAATVPTQGAGARLSFSVRDDFMGPTAGYHFAQVLVNGNVVWERDVAGEGGMEAVAVDLPAEGELQLALRLMNKKLVTNFGVKAQFTALRIVQGEKVMSLLPAEALNADYREFPPDVPLPALPAIGGWTRTANILQPWGVTEALAVTGADEWAPRLAKDFGLNAFIVLPPEAHNAITTSQPITEEQFQHAVTAYRAQGFRLILYTSIMHCGHAPAWQTGQLGREHPEWAMRDPEGGNVTTYGAPWLCPSTGALEYTLQYTEDLVRKYKADAVMLDNNEFISSDSGRATCYCDGCRAGFRAYMVKRFGAGGLKRFFNLTAEQVRIPEVEDDPLWGLWLSWRKRVWAEALETYRTRLRKLNPQIAVLANTAYLHRSWELAADAQFAHEDAVLSETRGLTPANTVGKMLLGQALAQGRPLWNYIGTFSEEDFKLLRPPDEVAGIVAASNATWANPWIVFYGFTGEENQAALQVMQQHLGFWSAHAQDFTGGAAAADIGVLFSPESRDLAAEPPLPAWVTGLAAQGQCLAGIWEPAALPLPQGVQVIVASGAPCLRRATAQRLAAWVNAGGTLMIRPDTGWRDEYGRWRAQNPLNEALKAVVTAPGPHVCSKGVVECVEAEAEQTALVGRLVTPRVTSTKPVSVQWRSMGKRQVMAVTGHEVSETEVAVLLPARATGVQVLQPGQQPVELVPDAEGTVRFVLRERLALISFSGAK